MATRCQLTRQPGRRWRTNGCWTCSGLLLCIISMLGMLARCAGSAETEALSGVDKQLNDALKQHCNAQRQIAITFTNKGYLDFALNWLHYVKELEVENYLIFALDSDAYQFLQEHQANTFYDPQLDQGHIDRRATDFGTDPFKKIVHLKPTLTLRVLELGYSLLLSDADVVWFRDPFKVPEVVGSHLNLMIDSHFGHSMGGTEFFVNSGFAFMKPEGQTVAFMQEVVRLLASRPDKMDQDAYNTAMSNWERRTGERLTFSVMDPATVSNGWVYFMRQLALRSEADVIAVHNNWADGGEGGNVHAQKVFRFREHLLWHADDDERYAQDKKYMTVQPAEAERLDVWAWRDLLTDALAIAQVMERALILPEFMCGGEEAEAEWLPARCTADAFLDVQALLDAFPDVRESSFLENYRVPLERVRPSTRILILSQEEAYAVRDEAALGGSYILTVQDHRGAASDVELVTLKEQALHVPLLVFGDVRGRFHGYEHPVSQLYLEKALRKGVQWNHYIREGANRINIKHVPHHCAAIHIPGWCGAECMARLPELLSRGPSHLIPKRCVFVVWLEAERRLQRMDSVIRALGAVFKSVTGVWEGALHFPLSDLWRMGDHFMVTSMQHVLVVNLQQFIYLLPAADAKLHRFDSETMRMRSEDRGMGGMQLTMATGELVQIPAYASKCPCPPYPENKMLSDVGLELQHSHRRIRLASQCFGESVAMNPNDVQAWLWLANAHLSQESFHQAAEAYAAANALSPDAAAFINQGVAYQRMGDNGRAADAYIAGIKLNPSVPEAHLNLAYALQDMGRAEEAGESFRRTIQLRPDFSKAHAGLASILAGMGQLEPAVQLYKDAIKHEPWEPQYRIDLGQALHVRGLFAEEQAVYRELLSSIGDHAVAYSYLATSILAAYQVTIGHRSYGKVPEDQIYLDQATELYTKAITVDPQCGMCHGQFGDMYKDSHKVQKSIEHYEQSAALLPHVPTIFCNLVYTKLFACDWSSYHADFDRLMKMVVAETDPTRPPPRHLCVQPLQGVLYRPLSAAIFKRVATTYTAKLLAEHGHVATVQLPASVLRGPAADNRLRVGYLTADFKDHPVAKRMQDVFGLHDKGRVRVTCYCLNANDHSHWRKKIEGGAERFVDMSHLLAAQGAGGVAAAVAADEVDVLINLAGHTRGNDAVTVIMAHRPAPVQLVHEGYAGTMGGARHSAHVTDKISSPPEYASHYVEKLLYMPDAFFVNDHRQTYPELQEDVRVEGEEKASRLAFGGLDPSIPFLFGAFNQLYKVEPEIWDTWMDAMRAAPHSHLWMIRIHSRDAEFNLKARAQTLGVSEHRIHVVQGYNERQHLYVKAAADVFLDTPSYNAHSTGCDVLWSGSPLLTMPGEKMGSRVAASLTAALHCPATIARNQDDYAEIAIALASKPALLSEAKECVRRGKVNAPLFDTKLWVAVQERTLALAADIAWAYTDASTGQPGAKEFHIIAAASHTERLRGRA